MQNQLLLLNTVSSAASHSAPIAGTSESGLKLRAEFGISRGQFPFIGLKKEVYDTGFRSLKRKRQNSFLRSEETFCHFVFVSSTSESLRSRYMHSFVILLLALFAFSLSYGAVHQVIVGPDGDIVFEPDSLIIAVGDSVVFNKTSKIYL